MNGGVIIMDKRILLVEDEPTNMEIMAGYLEDANYKVERATDGQEAWKILLADPNFDLVITDRRMPVMDGLTLVTEIKKHPTLRNMPIIMQTAASSPEEISEGVHAGVYYYLVKPYEEDTLLTVIRSALQEREKTGQFEQRLTRQKEALGTFVNGEFHIHTIEEAENIAFLLGSLFPRPELAINGLYELLLNAIEHGNLEIGYHEKNRLLQEMEWEKELFLRLQNENNKLKKVTVQFSQDAKQSMIIITDEGAGFDWQPFMEIEPSRATQGNGRGIAKANLISFDRLHFLGKGNQVEILSYK
jgi:CheY-like chemotaxis protein